MDKCLNFPARGGQIKSKMAELNILASKSIVILLIDLDNNYCPPILKEELLNTVDQKEEDFIFNVAVDEGEAWLFADRDHFASYIGVSVDQIPECHQTKLSGRKFVVEIDSPMKSSLLLTHKISLQSNKDDIIKRIGVNNPKEKCKGAEYNSAIVPFIERYWNVEIARKKSDSLDRMVRRIQQLQQRIETNNNQP